MISNDFSMIIFSPTLKRVDLKKDEKERNKRVELDTEKHWNAFSVPIVVEKIVAAGGEGREWRQKEMSAIG